MALTKNTQRVSGAHAHQLLPLPAEAGAVLYLGALVATNSSGRAVPAADTAGLTVQGVCREGLDNSGAAAGSLGTSADFMDAVRYVRVDAQGEWLFNVSAGAPAPGSVAYVVDDDTVSAAATANSIPAGKFTRPYSASAWFVDVERR